MRTAARRVGFSGFVLLAGAVSASAGEGARIVINDLEFAPPAVTVRVGDTVEWINKDIVDHTATARNGAFDVVAPKEKPARWRANKAGDFQYYCRLHPNMIGRILVTQ